MSLFSVGLGGLGTAQRALQTTSNNISNVNTKGYSREQVLLEENKSANGVNVNAVERQSNQFVAGQLNSANEERAALETYTNSLGQLDRLFADTDAGLSPIINDFFSSMRDMASSPANPAARQGVLGTAETMTSQFRALDNQLDDVRLSVNGQIESEVRQVNTIADQISVLNKEIIISKAQTGQEPNSLLNQRDRLVSDLSGILGTRLSIQNGGSFNISLENGSSLVAGDKSFSVEVVDSVEDPSRKTIAYRDAAGNLNQLREEDIQGGSLGGIVQFRREQLDTLQSKLGQLAVSLGSAFNEQHEKGIDLNGDQGGEFFNVGKPRLLENKDNASRPFIETEFTDTNQLSGFDYRIKVSDAAAGEFSITRTDGEKFTIALDANNEVEFEGVKLAITDPADLTDGDVFNLQPTRGAAGTISVNIKDTTEIAASQSTSQGDNRNALELQDLQSKLIVGGNASIIDGYAAMVGDVGNSSSVAQINLKVQTSLTDQVRDVQQSISGVNLDEEATNLIRYQQYYQANAKVIEIAGTLLENIFAIR